MNSWFRTHKRLLVLLILTVTFGGFLAVATARAPKTLDPQAYPHQRDGIVGPCPEYWLGTIQGGHDLAAYLGIAALRTLAVALAVSATALTFAFLVGGLWVLSRKEPRRSLLAVVILTCLGPTPLLMTVTVLYCFPDPGSWVALVISMGAVAWAPLALRLRNEVLRALDEPFVQEARRHGVGDLRLLWEEVFPLLRPVVESLGVLAGIGAVAAEATIGYLAGKALNNPSLGVLLDRSADAFRNASATDGVRLLASSAVVMTSIVAAFRLWGGWREDVRLARATPALPPEARRQTGREDGFVVSVWLRRLGRAIVKDILVPFLPGEIVVVAGGSGSGKSLTAAAIAGHLDPDLRGHCKPMGAARGKRVLMLPQGLQEVFAQTTPIDRYFASVGIGGDEALTLLGRVGLDAMAVRNDRDEWKTGKELAGGEAQRVAFCLALESALRRPTELRPDTLIVDEGVSALDGENADQVGTMLREAMARVPALAVIVVNHRPDWTARWGDYVAFLGNGRLLWSGPPDVLFGREVPPGAGKAITEYRDAVRLLQTQPAPIAPREAVVVDVSDLSAGYAGRDIVQQVSFKVHSGEALVITGRSGCGKTTLLRAVTGSEPSLKTSGSVSLLGGALASLTDEVRRSIRYAVQNPADNLNPAVTVEKILRRAVKRQRLADGEAVTRELMVAACRKASFPIEALSKTPAELNGGARIRAGLARTFLGATRVLFLDEPTAGLDPETALVVLDQLRDFLEEGGTIIAVMHDLEHIRYLGARILSLGSVRQAGILD
jgi:peptide/nickel transport system ATP-binding protein